ncbi:MAG: peptide chain release factor N(5)-glutamine methyltransferase [Firmicutes bacterium]|nr:peptide chain release factor N(5)-glutamine methyltransferase [Bacillota bacterium]
MSLPIKELISIGTKQLRDAGVADAEIDAKELYCYMRGMDRTALMLRWQEVMQDNQCEAYFNLIERRASRVPLQHITGRQEFMGLPFEVNEKVLIPRQDTETMVEDALELMEKGTLRGQEYTDGLKRGGDILDLCCGSGAIGISIAKLAKGAHVTCSDLSKDALEVADRNARLNDCKSVKFTESDMFAAFCGRLGKKKFNLIISNPPYIPPSVIEGLEPEVRDHEPMMALDGGADGLDFYRIIAQHAPEHLKKGGVLMLEIGFDQKDAVKGLLQETGRFEKIIGLTDLTGKDRIVCAVLSKNSQKTA